MNRIHKIRSDAWDDGNTLTQFYERIERCQCGKTYEPARFEDSGICPDCEDANLLALEQKRRLNDAKNEPDEFAHVCGLCGERVAVTPDDSRFGKCENCGAVSAVEDGLTIPIV